MFHRVRKLKPAVFKKVVPMQGDVTIDKLGLSDEQRETLAKEVSVVFHFAATLRLEAKLKDAIEMNTVRFVHLITPTHVWTRNASACCWM